MESAMRRAAMPVRRYSIDEFMQTTRMSGISFSHDEREILVTSNRTGVFNAFSIPVNRGPASQLTFSTDEAIRAISFFPNDRRILYLRDKGGIENTHLCIGETDGREVELTPGERVKSGFIGWNGDGKYFYYTANKSGQHCGDAYRVDADTYERSLICRNDDNYLIARVSPDGEYLSLVKYEGLSISDLYLFHVRSSTLTLITPHSRNVRYMPLYFNNTSDSLRYRARKDEDDAIEYCYNLKTREHKECERLQVNFRQIVTSESARYRAVISDEKETSSLRLHDYLTNGDFPLPSMPQGTVTSAAISKSDRWLAFYVNGDRDPTELYVCDLLTRQLSKLTNNVNPAINRADLVESSIVSFDSFDGMKIPCLLWKPHESSRERRVPALIWVHGGPIGQVRKTYAGAVQFLVNHGYAVLAVNHRGSQGYGREFLDAADGKQGREPLWDCVEARRYLASRNFIDPERIGIIGGSFGGYMAMAALAFHADEFAVGVAICGVSNLVRHVETKLQQPQAAQIYLQKVGDPVRDRAMLEAVSPALHAERIKSPLMVLHGAKDPRASRLESEDIVNAVRANGGIVDYLEFSDEAHGFRKRTNSIRAYQAILDFLDKYLAGSGEPRGSNDF